MNSQQPVLVWDILVRIFHWTLVASFAVAYLTSEDENPWHIYAGYTVLGLIVFRVIWGFVGSRYARFSDFIYSPANVVEYIKSLREGNPKHYLGHNPAGGWMVLAMLIMLFVVTLSGLKVYAIEEGKGPFAANAAQLSPISSAHAEEDEEENDDDNETSGVDVEKVSEADEEFWEEIHEIASNLMLVLIALHIAGVVASSRLHKENLVKAMLTGKKEK